MIDEDLRRLREAGLDRSLSGLEADVWQGLAVRTRHRTAARRRASLQGALMILAFLGSVAIGINATRSAAPVSARAVLALGLEFTPSSLLLGNVR